MSRRPIVGIMVGYILSDYSSDYNIRLVNAISSAIEKIGAVAKIYTTVEGAPRTEALIEDSDNLGRHWIAGLDYCRYDNPVAMVLIHSTIIHGRSDEEIKLFHESLPDVPVIIVGNSSVHIKNGNSIVVNGYIGMKEVVDHLIEKHGLSNIGMVSGSTSSNSAMIRLKAYKDSLAEHNILVRDEMIAYGNYFHTPDSVIEEIFKADESVEAIVAATDEMCNGIYRVAKARGRVIGKDLAVTGYDNTEASKIMNPPLTTVNADLEMMSDEIAGMIEEYLETGNMNSRSIPSTPVYRCSCGCMDPEEIEQKEGVVQTKGIYLDRDQIVEIEHRDASSALMLRSLLLKSVDHNSFYRKVGDSLYNLGTEASYILLHDEPVKISDESRFTNSENTRLVMYQKDRFVDVFSMEDAPVIKDGEAPDFVDRRDNLGVRMDFVLFYGDYRYGVLCVFAKANKSSMYRTLSLQIGSGIRYLWLAMRQDAMNKQLEEKNRLLNEQNAILDFSATHDGLTGLYNRVGFMQQALSLVRSGAAFSKYIAIMADVDHLKQINDNLGHPAGDLAITTAATILRDAVGEDGVVGRTGGDEFMGAVRMRDDNTCSEVVAAIKKACGNFDEEHIADFYMGVSVGTVIFDNSQEINFNAIFEKADEALYEDKKLRRTNVIR